MILALMVRGAGAGGLEGESSRVPHWVQNFASGGFSAPQEEHRAPSLAPHSAQNFARRDVFSAALRTNASDSQCRRKRALRKGSADDAALLRSPAAVDDDGLRGDEFALVAGKEQRRLRDLIGLAEAFENREPAGLPGV